MSVRYYVIQVHDSMRGWQDYPETINRYEPTPPFARKPVPAEEWVFKKEHEAITTAEAHTKTAGRVTRVIRKPKGWEPD